MTSVEDSNKKKTPEQIQREQEAWQRVRNKLVEFNLSLAPVPCICGRGNVSTIVGCDFCWAEHSDTFTAELEDPNFLGDKHGSH